MPLSTVTAARGRPAPALHTRRVPADTAHCSPDRTRWRQVSGHCRPRVSRSSSARSTGSSCACACSLLCTSPQSVRDLSAQAACRRQPLDHRRSWDRPKNACDIVCEVLLLAH